MIRKNLSVLAGSILLASNVQAVAVNPAVLGDAQDISTTMGSDMLLLLVDSTTNTTLIYNAGITADAFSAGGNVGFSVDLTTNSNYAGFNANGFALFGITSGSTAYSTIFETYADTGIGLVYASDSISNITFDSIAMRARVSFANAYITLADGNDILSAGNSFNNQFISTTFGGLIQSTGSIAEIFLADNDGDGNVIASNVEVTNNIDGGNIVGVYKLGDTFFVQNTIIPIPASFWFMGSALAGIAAIQRKRQA